MLDEIELLKKKLKEKTSVTNKELSDTPIEKIIEPVTAMISEIAKDVKKIEEIIPVSEIQEQLMENITSPEDEITAWTAYQFAIYPAPKSMESNKQIELDELSEKKIKILDQVVFKNESAKDVMLMANLEAAILVRKATETNMPTTIKKIKAIFDNIKKDDLFTDFNKSAYLTILTKESMVYALSKRSLRTIQRRKKKNETEGETNE